MFYFITFHYSTVSCTQRLEMSENQTVAEAMMARYGKQIRPVQKKAIDEGRYTLTPTTLEQWHAEKRQIW